ncbi:hypothetical protein SBA3_1820016 [Candidatus Sulfopaludibacter sp. SbA3]|nr:hypothetical protein SBA3_1820016 [Candidatus Sulfopaludibacter sp. SbA3]
MYVAMKGEDMQATSLQQSIAEKIKQKLAAPITSDDVIDPQQELAEVLSVVGLTPDAGGGSVSFIGKEPILKGPWPLATMAGVALMAKAVAAADTWRYRTGQGQDLTLDLRRAPHRLCPFYDHKWELLNGYPPADAHYATNPFSALNWFPTKDGRWMHIMNLYPKARTRALAFFGCADNFQAISEVTRKWNSLELEEEANRRGVQATVVRTVEEFMALEQFQYLAVSPLVNIEKIGDSAPEPFPRRTARRHSRARPGARDCRRRAGQGPRLPWRGRPEYLETARLRTGVSLLHGARGHAILDYRIRRTRRHGSVAATGEGRGYLLLESPSRLSEQVASHGRRVGGDPAGNHPRGHVSVWAYRTLGRQSGFRPKCRQRQRHIYARGNTRESGAGGDLRRERLRDVLAILHGSLGGAQTQGRGRWQLPDYHFPVAGFDVASRDGHLR